MNLDAHPCFTRFEDPDSGVVSYQLSEHVAPLQKCLYYISPAIRGEGRYLWFRGCFPPSKARMLAVVDLASPEKNIRVFPQSCTGGGPTCECTPLVHAKGDAALRASGEDLLLVVWGRRSLDDLEFFGDREVAAQWIALAS